MRQTPSFRSQFVTKRTYNRPLDEDGTIFETFEQTIDRVIQHQKWLWETAKGKLIGEDFDELNEAELAELEELRQLMLNYEAMVSGRTLWLGGTDVSKRFHATQFNCSFSQIRTVHDLVDAFHNLLLGVGVGFEPITGILNGFAKPVEVEIIRSTRTGRGDDNNKERHYRRGDKRVWQMIVGDSGVAWAKAAGKLISMKKPVDIVILDFSEIRPGGKPLKGFGWISSGDEQISLAFSEIAKILNRRAGELLTRMDILDIMNWLGTSLSSRRSAEIALIPADDPEAEEFAVAKKDYWKSGNPQRSQSNNSLIFYHKPTKRELRGIFSQMLDAGGSEPGFINGAAARKRAPWFRGVNPCCFVGDTLVDTPDGELFIKDIVEKVTSGEKVKVESFDEKSNALVFAEVVAGGLTRRDADIITLHFETSSSEVTRKISCTPDHLFLTHNRGWVEAKDLTSEDDLVATNLQLRLSHIVQETQKQNVYDIEVKDTHTFLVSGLVVHNCEILLGEKSFCNLVTIDLGKFNGREEDLHRAFWIMGRANYRQTCVDFRDPILQNTWHELNQFLRLTGMGCAGIVTWEHHKSPKHIAELRRIARKAVDSMAEELNLPKSKAVTTTKPDGTVGKLMDTTEGIHKPLSKYIINNIIVSNASPLRQVAIDAGYRYFPHPFDTASTVISLPIAFENVEFDTVEAHGKTMEVNLESAVSQLNRYKMWMDNYADHNISITVSYSPDEVEQIVDWLHSNWDHFVGVSFLLRNDPTKTAEDLGYPYLPQECITKEEYEEYVAQLKPVDLDNVFVNSLDPLENDCAGGVCPVR